MIITVQFDEVVLDLEKKPPVPEKLLEQAAGITLQQAYSETEQEPALTVVLTGDEAIQALNNQYLGIDAPTDVLSFPAGEIDPETQALYLGGVILSYPRALSASNWW